MFPYLVAEMIIPVTSSLQPLIVLKYELVVSDSPLVLISCLLFWDYSTFPNSLLTISISIYLAQDNTFLNLNMYLFTIPSTLNVCWNNLSVSLMLTGFFNLMVISHVFFKKGISKVRIPVGNARSHPKKDANLLASLVRQVG